MMTNTDDESDPIHSNHGDNWGICLREHALVFLYCFHFHVLKCFYAKLSEWYWHELGIFWMPVNPYHSRPLNNWQMLDLFSRGWFEVYRLGHEDEPLVRVSDHRVMRKTLQNSGPKDSSCLFRLLSVFCAARLAGCGFLILMIWCLLIYSGRRREWGGSRGSAERWGRDPSRHCTRRAVVSCIMT
jgi:hypothetical protein